MKISDFNNYLIQEGQNDRLSEVGSDPWDDIPQSKKRAREEMDELNLKLADLQQKLFVDRRKSF